MEENKENWQQRFVKNNPVIWWHLQKLFEYLLLLVQIYFTITIYKMITMQILYIN